jgi:acetyl-CoA carboxylase carboxyl transferase subunit alpha
MSVAPLEFERPVLELEKKLDDLKRHLKGQDVAADPEVKRISMRISEMRKDLYDNLTPWQRVQIARHTARPYALDYVANIFDDFVELRGDRLFGEDRAMPGGFATIGGHPCVIVGHQKGRDTKDNILRNFGSANPEGYRKALRLMKLAEKFGLPVITMIDTPGAYPGVGAEERHIAEAIAVNLREMMLLETPTIACVIGEGGSGGALGIGVADRVLILENAYYSVISPEGCAAILWKHRSHAAEAAAALKLSSPDLKAFGMVDDVVPEPPGGAHHDPAVAADNLKRAILKHLTALLKMPKKKLLAARYAKFRKFGIYTSATAGT